MEIGFGNGSFLRFAKDKGCNITGIEIIPELIRRAKEKNFEVYSDINELPENSKFNVIVLFDVLEHISQDEISDFLTNLNKLLKINGTLILRTPNGSSPFGLTNQHGDTTHCTVVTGPKLDYWAQNTGFKLEFVGGDPYIIYEGKISKVISRLIRRILYLFIERLTRWIFAPQSKGFLTSNLFAVLKKK